MVNVNEAFPSNWLAAHDLKGKEITLEDIFKKHEFSSKFIWGMRHLSDGKRFSKMK